MTDHIHSSDKRHLSVRSGRGLVWLVLGIVGGYAPPAHTHGDADWIMKNPEYVDQFGHKCCGPEDCERMPESFVREDGPDIYVLPTRQVFRKGHHGAYPSRDSSWWWCRRPPLPGQALPPAACVFFPFHGQ